MKVGKYMNSGITLAHKMRVKVTTYFLALGLTIHSQFSSTQAKIKSAINDKIHNVIKYKQIVFKENSWYNNT